MLPGSLYGAQAGGYRCLISFGGNAFDKNQFEILDNSADFAWSRHSNGELPAAPMIGGNSRKGDALYVCKGTIDGETIFGKIRVLHGGCLIPHDDQEKKLTEYWVLSASS